ncbi:MAG TPA: DUF3052 domain-containing protein [Acidimicrobiia bacterium]|nr:DUF3052 domain-containing protein [Acidimicrobiia bacterium]
MLPKKLGITEGARVALVSAPDGFERELTPLPDGVRLMRAPRANLDVVVFFVTRRAELTRRFPRLAKTLHCDGGLWIAWPKRTAGVVTDLCERDVREVGLAGGLVDNKVCAVDDMWSSLRFVYRLSDRPKSRTRPPTRR